MTAHPKTTLMILLGAGGFFPLMVQAAFPTLYMKPVVRQQFHSPTNILSVPDTSGRLFVTDQPGRIFVVKDGMMRPVPFLDISATAPAADRRVVAVTTGYSERGLLGMAFHPGYANPASPGFRKFYLNYNKDYVASTDPPPAVADHTPNAVTVISEFQVSAANPDLADPGTERRLMAFTQPQSNHNGGQLAFGPDGMLYIAAGDGGSADDNNVGHTGGAGTNPRPTAGLGNGQDKTSFLGKIHRIDPLDPDGAGPLAYGIPADNPFVNDTVPNGLKKEIYAYGLRNPWRFSFDTRPGGSGRLFCCDVGQVRVEEVNIIVSGGNYGWRYLEGTEMPSFSSGSLTNPMPDPGGPMIAPIAQYAHPNITGSTLPQLGVSGTGGYVYRGSAIPALQGKYVFADYGATSGAPSGRLMGLEETAEGSGVFTLTEAIPMVDGNPFSLRVLCLGEDENGEIYVGTKVTGGVLELVNGLPNGGLYKLTAAPVNPPPIVLEPVKDASIFEESGAGNGELANGAGELFVGLSAELKARRALLAFDLSAIPAGTRFATASLSATVKQVAITTPPPARNFTMHRLLKSWGEGTTSSPTGGVPAAAGDVTWLNRSFPDASQAWTAPGGDFETNASSLFSMAGPGVYAWQGSLMLQDIHGWLAGPASNQGWLLRSDETNPLTAKVLDSRAGAAGLRPKLTLVPESPYGTWLGTWFPNLLTGQYLDPDGDSDGDGTGVQIEYVTGLNPMLPQTATPLSASVASAGGEVVMTTVFRRNASATDATLRLQTGSDLAVWTDIAVSTAGGTVVGENGGVVVSEEVAPDNVRIVTVRRTQPAGAFRQFVRLLAERLP